MMKTLMIIVILLYIVNSITSSSIVNSDSNDSNSNRQLLEETIVTDIDTKTKQKDEIASNKGNDPTPIVRTATGGFIHTIMVFLTIVSFIGNGAFMVYVFWLSK